MHHLDTDKLYRDIRVKLNKVDKSQDYLAAKIKTSRRTIWKVGKGYVIALDTFFKLCHWLDEEPSKYIVKLTKKEHATKKRLNTDKQQSS